jgi:hypothetical protein
MDYDLGQGKSMNKIVQLRTLSVAWLFAVLYGMVGLYASTKSVLQHDESVLCPFGFDFGMCRYTINVTLHAGAGEWQPWSIIVISVVFYALTGAISGAAVALLYNLTAPIGGGISGRVESAPVPSQPGQGIGLI